MTYDIHIFKPDIHIKILVCICVRTYTKSINAPNT